MKNNDIDLINNHNTLAESSDKMIEDRRDFLKKSGAALVIACCSTPILSMIVGCTKDM